MLCTTNVCRMKSNRDISNFCIDNAHKLSGWGLNSLLRATSWHVELMTKLLIRRTFDAISWFPSGNRVYLIKFRTFASGVWWILRHYDITLVGWDNRWDISIHKCCFLSTWCNSRKPAGNAPLFPRQILDSYPNGRSSHETHNADVELSSKQSPSRNPTLESYVPNNHWVEIRL